MFSAIWKDRTMNYKVFIIFISCMFGITMCCDYTYRAEAENTSYKLCFVGIDKNTYQLGCRDGDGVALPYAEWLRRIKPKLEYDKTILVKNYKGDVIMAKVYWK